MNEDKTVNFDDFKKEARKRKRDEFIEKYVKRPVKIAEGQLTSMIRGAVVMLLFGDLLELLKLSKSIGDTMQEKAIPISLMI